MELAKLAKNEDGYAAYRHIWKKNVAKDLAEDNVEKQDEEERQGEKEKEQEA